MNLIKDLAAKILPAGGTTTTTTTFNNDISWENWSPEFHPFIPYYVEETKKCSYITNWPNTTIENPKTFPIESDKKQRLLHLLKAAAEALSFDLNGQDLARVILVRLRELLQTDYAGSGIERIASHFTNALHGLLDILPPHHYSPVDVLTAFQLLQEMSPFASFGHFTANQAILEAVAGERRVHIVDYNIGEGVQWASLIQAMESRKLKITAITNGSRNAIFMARQAGRRLKAFAASLGQPFSFRLCRLDLQKQFKPSAITVCNGEALLFNCVLHPAHNCHGYSSIASVSSFFYGAVALGARIITIVEENTVTPGEKDDGFLLRFTIELERYIAVWESLETEFSKQGWVNGMVEKVMMGPMITGAVRRAYGHDGKGESTAGKCGEWMEMAGFRREGLSFFNLCQARLLVGLFNDGYNVEKDGMNKIVLSWKSRRLLSASVWAVPMLKSTLPSPSLLPAFSLENICL